MFFTHDPETDIYYWGDEEPKPGFVRRKLFEETHKLISVDVETISLKERIAVGVGISITPRCSFYFPLFPNQCSKVPWHLLQDPSVTKVFHNSLFDLSALREYDVDTTGIMDTNVMSRLLCHKHSGLSDLTWLHEMEVHDMKAVLLEHKARTTMELPPEVCAKKCMQDTSATLQLYFKMIDRMDKDYLSVEMQLIPIMIEMSNRGILIDQEMREDVEIQLQEQVDFFYGLCEEEGFSPGSPQQVAYTLAKRGAYKVFSRLPWTNYKKNQLATGVKILEKMDDPLASIILQHRKHNKLLGTYIKPWSHDERATTRFHLDAITGRPSSTDRNMQNIPGKYAKDGSLNQINCRAILLPDSGVWTDTDWRQLEPRVLGYLSGDKEMQYIFSLPELNPDGTKNEAADIHLQVANFMGITRRLGKLINLAMTYGATDQTLMENAGIRDIGRIKQLRMMWGQKFPGAMDYIESVQHDSLITGRAKTVFGREIRLPSQDEESVDSIHRKAVDYPCQGSASEILKRGLILLKDLPIALQIHDELLVDGFIPDYRFKPLESIAPFPTPVGVSYLDRWE